MSDRCCDLADKILKSIMPKAEPGTVSTISDQHIEERIDVAAVALCWHLAAVSDQTRRAGLSKQLVDGIFSLVCLIEAARRKLEKGVTIELALSEISKRYNHMKKI
jgi:hypothetical protein